MSRSKSQARFQVDVYTRNKKGYNVRAFGADDEKTAKVIAFDCFAMLDVYKVKVWDLDKGDREPNIVNAPGLILELV